MDEKKKLYRIEDGKMIAGVCTGLGEYLNIDVTIIRLLWVFFVLAAGTGILAYLLAAIIIPQKEQD